MKAIAINRYDGKKIKINYKYKKTHCVSNEDSVIAKKEIIHDVDKKFYDLLDDIVIINNKKYYKSHNFDPVVDMFFNLIEI